MDPVISVVIIAILAIIALSVFLSFFPIMLWVAAVSSGVQSKYHYTRSDASSPGCS